MNACMRCACRWKRAQLRLRAGRRCGPGDGRDEDSERGDGRERGTDRRVRVTYKITNNSQSVIDTHLLLVAQGLSTQIDMENASGRTSTGSPYLRVFLPNGVLLPGQSIVETLRFKRESHAPPVSFTLTLLSGQGNP